MEKVIIYYSDTCTHCHEAMKYFENKNVPYESRNIKEKEFRNELLKQGYRSVPIIQIDGENIVGFDKEAIDKKLGF